MGNVQMDATNALAFTQTLSMLDITMNTDVHLNAAANAAFAILDKTFGIETDAMAYLNDSEFMHVYEWEHVGNPSSRLFKPILTGQGRHKTVSWQWLPSKTNVPINPDDYPADFDTSRLNHNHIFVWKAPVMEYGTVVRVKRKYSKVLVIPFPDNHSDLFDAPGQYYSDGQRDVLITKRSYSFSPGRDSGVVGNFTTWFQEWWGQGRAETIIDEIFSPMQNSAFKREFEKNVAELTRGQSSGKAVTFNIQTARLKGTKAAERIAAGMTEEYKQIARSEGGFGL